MATGSPFIADIVIPVLQLIGGIFLALLKMLIVPLVFSSLIMGASSIGDPKVLGRIGVKTVAFYLGTTVVAIIIGLILGNVIQPGVGMAIEGAKAAAKEPETIFSVILNIFPANPLQALVNGVMLQVIVFALFLARGYANRRKRQGSLHSTRHRRGNVQVASIVMKTARSYLRAHRRHGGQIWPRGPRPLCQSHLRRLSWLFPAGRNRLFGTYYRNRTQKPPLVPEGRA
ncbi:MAG: dicarboxylate/amino acid:cation symporter [Cloacibacillus evryensis]